MQAQIIGDPDQPLPDDLLTDWLNEEISTQHERA
jgi:hypothetical protein